MPSAAPAAPAAAPGLPLVLLWSGVNFAATGAGLTWTTFLVLGRPADPLLIAFAFCVIAAVYTRDRLLSADPSGTPRDAWVARHGRALRAWAALCVVALIPLSVLRPWCAVALAVAGTMGWFYATPLFRAAGRTLAPRQVAGVKLPYVMAAWLAVCVLLPAAQEGLLRETATWWLAASFVSILSATAIVNDLRDIEADRRGGTARCGCAAR